MGGTRINTDDFIGPEMDLIGRPQNVAIRHRLHGEEVCICRRPTAVDRRFGFDGGARHILNCHLFTNVHQLSSAVVVIIRERSKRVQPVVNGIHDRAR